MFNQDQKLIYEILASNQIENTPHTSIYKYTIKEMCEKYIDEGLVRLIFENDFKQEQADFIQLILEILKIFQDHIQQEQIHPLFNMLNDKSNSQTFIKNFKCLIKMISYSIKPSINVSNNSYSSLEKVIDIQSQNPLLQQFQDYIQWFVKLYLNSILQQKIPEQPFEVTINLIPVTIFRQVNPKILQTDILELILDLLPKIYESDSQTIKGLELSDSIYFIVKERQSIFQALTPLLTVKQIQNNQNLLNQIGDISIYFLKLSIKYYDIGLLPQYLLLLIKLQKLSRDEYGWQIDVFQKNNIIQLVKEILSVVLRYINKTSINQLSDYCSEFQKFVNLGFDILNQLNFFITMIEFLYRIESQILKIKLKIQQLSAMKDENPIFQEYFLTEQKLKYISKQFLETFVKCFYQDENYIKSQNDKRIYLLVQIWNNYYDTKQDPLFANIFENDQQIKDIFQSKSEEQLIRKLTFFKIGAKLILFENKSQFRQYQIVELIFPKVDLNGIIQQSLVLQIRNDKPSTITTQTFLQRLYKFYLALLQKGEDLREKILKELASSIQSLIISELHSVDLIKQTMININHKGNLIQYVAQKIELTYKILPLDEQVKFLNEILTVVVQQFSKLEDEFFNSVETCKGSVEGMRQVSIFRQLVEKAQGQKQQNLSIGSIVEKKVIDLKKTFQMIPLLSKCCQSFQDEQFQSWVNSGTKFKTQCLILEFWIYIHMNNPNFIVYNFQKEKKNVQKLSSDEKKELSVVLQPLQLIYQEMDFQLNHIAFITPNLLPGSKVSFADSKVLVKLTENQETYTCKNFYQQNINQYIKNIFKIKKKQFRLKLETQDKLFIALLNDIMNRCMVLISQDMSVLQNSTTSFITKFLGFVRQRGNDDEDDQQTRDKRTMARNNQDLKLNIVKTIKFNYFVKESITRVAMQYNEFLVQQKGTLTKEIISRDFIYLIQVSCSIEKTLKEYAQDMTVDFMRCFPFVIFNPNVLKTFSQIISFIHQKIGKEFDSKSTSFAQFNQHKILIHTDQKELTITLIFLMNCLLKLIFRGLYIDHNFIKVLILNFIKQETSLMSQLPFGYRFLKFMITSFKIDKDAVESFKNNADRYNPYFWMVKEIEFDSKIASSDLSQFVVDKSLVKLQKINIEQNIPYQIASDILKSIDYQIKNEVEFDFHLDESQYNNQSQHEQIISQIFLYCQDINLCLYFSNNKYQFNQKFIKKLQLLEIQINPLLIGVKDPSEYKNIKKQLVREMLLKVTSLKSVLQNKGSQVKQQILSQLLDLCKNFLQPQLLKFVLMRLIPYLHSISPSYFDSTFFFLIGEMLNYTIYQINNLGNLKYDAKTSSQDIFQIKSNYFNSLTEFEQEEFNLNYFKILKTRNVNLVNLAQIGFYDIRWKCLCKIHCLLIKFLNDNMQIHLVKNVKLSIIANILKLNHSTDKKVVEFIPLENICQVLKGSIEIIQLMKDLQDKYKQGQVKFNIESFYYKTLKLGLNHFSKNQNIYKEPLFQECVNIQKLVKRHQLFTMVCKYLSKDKLHEFSETNGITKLKRVKKHFNSMIFKTHRQEELNIDNQNKSHGLKATIVITGWSTSMIRKIQADIGYNNQQSYALNLNTSGQFDDLKIRPYYLRKALFFMLCDELDKIKAIAHKLQPELQTDYSLLTQTKLSEDFLQQILKEIPDKNLNLSFMVIQKLYPILEKQYDSINDVLKKFIGPRILQTHQQYLDCSHFFDIFVSQSNQKISGDLIYWKAPHIQLLLKYITEEYQDYPEIQLCFSKIMKRLHSEQIIFYLPQVIQSLASRQGALIKQFLIEFATQSVLFAHQLIWLAKVECKIDPDHKRPPTPKQVNENFKVLRSQEYNQQLNEMINKGQVSQNQLFISKITPIIIQKVIRNMDSEQTAFFKRVDGFFEQVTAISGILRPQMPKQEKRDIIARELKQIAVTPDIYMPTNPRFQISRIKLDSGAPMQSAAKCPILVTFICKKYEGPDKYFEKKLKIQKQENQKYEDKIREEYDKQFQIDEVDEERGPLFINQLSRPLQHSRQSMHSSQQSIKFQQKKFAESMNQELESQKHKIIQQVYDRYFIYLNINFIFQKQRLESQNQHEDENKSCIFKVFDDIRQDTLAIQIITMFKGIFDRFGLDLFVFPYKCISNRTGIKLNVGGIIEVIPNTISRDQMGKTNRCNLYEYFISKFGQEDTLSFQVARENFIKSQAAYSIISYILQIKDRHNGNILISDKGNLIHIDFGFIFDISPGGNMKFESANFKLTKEMIMIMGGSQDSEAFKYYIDQTVRAFLAVRRYYEHMFYIVKLMRNSGLGCFMKDSLKNFTERFQLKKNDLAAAKQMRDIINDACDKLTTNLYDDIQRLQNGIAS